MLTIEIEQLEEKLELIKTSGVVEFKYRKTDT